jgi:hypothetical protein
MHGFETPKRSLYTPVGAEPATKLSYLKLACLTIGFLGVQFGWAIQIAFTTPIFLELGVPHIWVSFIWLAGPISGLIVQPVVGAVSDGLRSPFGRRRPFIFVGAIFIIVGLVLISNARTVGGWLGDIGNDHARAIVIAIVGFWILDLSNNTVQGPCRALLVDVAPADQQAIGGSFFSFMLGTGSLVGYFTGHLSLIKYFPFMVTDVRALFSILYVFAIRKWLHISIDFLCYLNDRARNLYIYHSVYNKRAAFHFRGANGKSFQENLSWIDQNAFCCGSRLHHTVLLLDWMVHLYCVYV